VERAVKLRTLVIVILFGATLWSPRTARAQSTPASPAPSTSSGTTSKSWFVIGVPFVTQRGDCQTCEEEAPFRHGGGLLGNAGYRVNTRMDVGAEIFWTSMKSGSGHIRTTHLDAVAEFRPWSSQGFFVKGGAGMAFVRNWVDTLDPDPITSKALSVVVGAGWTFRPNDRVGFQIFGSQHAGAIGDLQTTNGEVTDVIGNFWSTGFAIVIR
jgi:hypothetical protein